jgi:hypothetical protein
MFGAVSAVMFSRTLSTRKARLSSPASRSSMLKTGMSSTPVVVSMRGLHPGLSAQAGVVEPLHPFGMRRGRIHLQPAHGEGTRARPTRRHLAAHGEGAEPSQHIAALADRHALDVEAGAARQGRRRPLLDDRAKDLGRIQTADGDARDGDALHRPRAADADLQRGDIDRAGAPPAEILDIDGADVDRRVASAAPVFHPQQVGRDVGRLGRRAAGLAADGQALQVQPLQRRGQLAAGDLDGAQREAGDAVVAQAFQPRLGNADGLGALGEHHGRQRGAALHVGGGRGAVGQRHARAEQSAKLGHRGRLRWLLRQGGQGEDREEDGENDLAHAWKPSLGMGLNATPTTTLWRCRPQ